MGIEKIPLSIPEQWSPTWFRTFIVEVLARLDTRNSIGIGVDVSSVGNSVATLNVSATIQAAIDEHELATDPHPDIIDELPAATVVALTDLVMVSQAGTNKQATIQQVKDSLFGDDWDDLRFPAQSVNPTGAAAPPSVDATTTGVTGTLLFAGNAENIIAGIAQMPHAWKAGSAIHPHIHWSMPTGTTDAVTWEFWYRMIGTPGDVLGAWVGPLSPAGTVGSQSVSDEHLLSYFAAVSMTGKLESTCLAWRIHRRGDTDAASGQARLYEFDIHYQVAKAGTDAEYPT